MFADPDHARIDGSGRRGDQLIVGGRRLELRLDDQDQAVDEVRQAEIDAPFALRYGMLYCSEAPQTRNDGCMLDVGSPAIRIEAVDARAAARDGIADLPGDGERPQPPHRIRQFAETFAEEQRRRERAELLGADARGAAAAPFDVDRRPT